MASWGRATQQSWDTRKTNKAKQPALFPIEMIAKLEWTQSNPQPNIEQIDLIHWNIHGHQGGGPVFFLCIYYRENINNPLAKNYLANLQIIWQKFALGDPLPRLFKFIWSIKNMVAWSRGNFYYVDHRKISKNHLLKTSMQTWNQFSTYYPWTTPLQSLHIFIPPVRSI